MKLGLIGLPQSGKTTLFQILTQSPGPASGKLEDHLGVIRIPDPRLDALSALFKPKKTTPATFEIIDPAHGFPGVGARPKGLDKDPYVSLRNADALVLVVRAFANDTVPHVAGSIDAGRDRAQVEQELVLSDLIQVESRLERVEKLERIGKKAEKPLEKPTLSRFREALTQGTPLREVEISSEEEKLVRGYAYLSQKPLLVVYNTGEGGGGAPSGMDRRGISVVQLPARAELEVSRLPEEERQPFRELFSIPEAGLATLLRATQEVLDLITFFTSGKPEVRAWHLKRGSTAVEAAGKIHTDMERGFIRAEVLRCEHLLEAGSWGATRERGWFRTEGRDYVIQDGDVLLILFNT